ncbi:MAG: PEP-CTERM sorting domain-containing protein [Planctomycetota bacterium]
MKRILIFTLMLGLTSTAAATNAGKTVQLAIVEGGVGTPAPDVVGPLEVSDWIELGIIVNGNIDVMELDLDVIGPGHVELPAEPTDIFVETWTIEGPVTPAPPGVSQIVAMDLYGTHSGLVVYKIMFHCDGVGDVLVQITDFGLIQVDGRDIPPEELGSIIILQSIPEPTTVMLLGLGSLFLLRRKSRA